MRVHTRILLHKKSEAELRGMCPRANQDASFLAESLVDAGAAAEAAAGQEAQSPLPADSDLAAESPREEATEEDVALRLSFL